MQNSLNCWSTCCRKAWAHKGRNGEHGIIPWWSSVSLQRACLWQLRCYLYKEHEFGSAAVSSLCNTYFIVIVHPTFIVIILLINLTHFNRLILRPFYSHVSSTHENSLFHLIENSLIIHHHYHAALWPYLVLVPPNTTHHQRKWIVLLWRKKANMTWEPPKALATNKQMLSQHKHCRKVAEFSRKTVTLL